MNMTNVKVNSSTQYKIIRLIGEGSFGKAYLVEIGSSGKLNFYKIYNQFRYFK